MFIRGRHGAIARSDGRTLRRMSRSHVDLSLFGFAAERSSQATTASHPVPDCSLSRYTTYSGANFDNFDFNKDDFVRLTWTMLQESDVSLQEMLRKQGRVALGPTVGHPRVDQELAI